MGFTEVAGGKLYKKSAPSVASGNEQFLATTALEEFWDISRPMLFLSETCRRFSRKSVWENLDAQVIPSPYASMAEVEAAWHRAVALYEELLEELADAMNDIHGTNHGLRYWRIILGPWLLFYVHVHLDRYLRITHALSLHPELTTIGLAKDSYVTPRDSIELVNLCKTDLYNVQIYSQILSFLGKSLNCKDYKPDSEVRRLSKEKLTPKLFVLKSLNVFIKKATLFTKDRPGVFLINSYFSPEVELKLFFRSGGGIRLVSRKPVQLSSCPVERDRRARIQGFLASGDNFRTYLKQVIPYDIPSAFVESFVGLNAEVELYPEKPSAIFSSNAYIFDEAFKVWAAKHAELGALLLYAQHGGNYGITRYLHQMDHEIAISDRYYTWGWPDAGFPGKVKPFSAAKLSGRSDVGADNRKQGILLAVTTYFRFLVQFPFIPELFEKYLCEQQLFIGSVDAILRSLLRVRMLAETLGWDLLERLKCAFPEVSIEQEGDCNFIDSLYKCRLFVADHISTTYIEALSANVPTIMFYDEATYPVKEEAVPSLDLLRKAGILFDTPEAAAETVNLIYSDVESWWNESSRQRLRKEFCNRYGRKSNDAVGECLRELGGILKNPTMYRNGAHT